MDAILKVTNLTVFYENKKIIDNLNLEFKKGEFVCMISKPSEIKTILLRSLILLNDDISKKYRTTGKILYKGEEISKDKRKLIRESIVYLGKEALFAIDDLTMREALTLMIGRKKILRNGFELSSILSNLNILSKLPIGVNTKLMDLNMNVKILFFVSLSLLKDPDVIIFDGILDDLEGELLKNLIRFLEKIKDKVFIISTKNVRKFIGLSDRAIFMEDDKIIFDGDPKDIIINWGRSDWKF